MAAIPPPPLLAGKTVAVARDAAFRFLYPANLELLAAMGARLAFFSPLADARLPACDALWLPGGYPELHAAQLAANRGMLDALRDAHGAGLPMLAECGGMMALFDTLVDKEGLSHAMAGLLPGTVRMQRRLSALGPQAVALPEGSCAATPSTIRRPTARWSRPRTPPRHATARAARRSTAAAA